MNYTLIPFSSSIFLPNRNIKIKNFEDFKNLKPHRGLNTFYEATTYIYIYPKKYLKLQFQLQINMAS